MKLLVPFALALVISSCGGGGGGGGDTPPVKANVAEILAALLNGSDDFSGMSGQLGADTSGDPQARLLKGIVDFLAMLDGSGTQPGGRLYDLYTRAGLTPVNADASFWDFDLTAVAHNEGDIKNSTPTVTEFVNFLIDEFRPALQALATVLDATEAGFELEIPVPTSGPFAAAFGAAGANSYVLDYGDLMVVATNVYLLMAQVEMFVALDWNNLAPNDFDEADYPGRDFLALIEGNYGALGNILRPGELGNAKHHLQTAYQRYGAAASHLRNENAQQQLDGILTLGRDTFASEQERNQFLADEQSFRAWLQPIVNAFDNDNLFMIDTAPDGSSLATEDTIEINFYRFFQGVVSPRSIYFKLVGDPLDNDRRTFGVTDLSQLTTDMQTLGGVIGRIGGRMATAGDLQGAYALRVDSPAVSTKIIDGSFTDWASGSTLIAARPALGTAADLGQLFVAKDATHVYLYLDRDLNPVADYYSIEVESALGYASLTNYSGTFYENGIASRQHVSGQGLEFSIPKSLFPGGWVSISIDVEKWSGPDNFSSTREQMLVNIQ
ncbi:MAG: hypothetical protein KDC98_02770 [Planctomycetes bacterium]|nr:hypothetical protein [Planctomycetota bacterium]